MITLIEESQNLSKVLEVFVSQLNKPVNLTNLEKNFNDSNIIPIIETYCALNNIETKKQLININDGYDDDEIIVSDIVKQYLQETKKFLYYQKKKKKN